ncbi:response regulator [Dinghuibacter silviterrae]|uniref:LuxR family two component transcriptional regulator n=1 Tax=Dinghuibacter silviterrae TaxID=1539049 RepID=A0A4R8DEF5_9BACT|nr:response regulator transcription factor [Dinghuibacter silviterrae]TDW95911.1 LuxR family two component transcriptional regulator [Dinghuibacter silviterrae]
MRILIADDHLVVRKGLINILSIKFPFATIGEVSTTEELIGEVFKEDWDIVISDIDMPGRSGLEAIQQIKQFRPKLPILILSFHSEHLYATRVLRAGASGYLKKDMAAEELVEAIHKIMAGKKYISATVAEMLAEDLDAPGSDVPHELLSDREFEILRQLATGKSIIEIAELFSISPSTVSTHRARILAKMHMKSNAELTLYVFENKLGESSPKPEK